jgi:hypothetical protein
MAKKAGYFLTNAIIFKLETGEALSPSNPSISNLLKQRRVYVIGSVNK